MSGICKLKKTIKTSLKFDLLKEENHLRLSKSLSLKRQHSAIYQITLKMAPNNNRALRNNSFSNSQISFEQKSSVFRDINFGRTLKVCDVLNCDERFVSALPFNVSSSV